MPVTPAELPDPIAQLRLIEADPRRYLRMHHPVKAALWLALMRPVEELMARESFIEIDASGEAKSIPALTALAETVARRALRGDMVATAMIADRIEGKVGARRGEEDPEDQRRRGDMQSVIEAVVSGLVNNRIAGGEALDITPAESPYPDSLDSERQDSDTRTSLAEERRRDQEDSQARGASLVQTNDSPEERDLTDPQVSPPYTNGHGGHSR